LISSLGTCGVLGCGSGGVLGCSGNVWPLESWDWGGTAGGLTLFPQLGQNREPSGSSFPHFGQYIDDKTPLFI